MEILKLLKQGSKEACQSQNYTLHLIICYFEVVHVIC
jgi:hypothetical protein